MSQSGDADINSIEKMLKQSSEAYVARDWDGMGRVLPSRFYFGSPGLPKALISLKMQQSST